MKILHKTSGAILFEDDAKTMRETVIAAVSSSADLRSADLSGANLRSADLSGADLSFTDLSGADLSSADLSGADLSFTDLSGADLSSANLSSADLRYADLRSAKNLPAAPIVKNIDAKILAACEKEGCSLEMGNWHKCETTHCRAGWAIHLAGEVGYALEEATSSYLAGKLIYEASRPGVPAPDFFASNEEAMEDIRKCAGTLN